MTPTATAARRLEVPVPSLSNGVMSFEDWTGLEVPDPITFIFGERWLDRGTLYPRQATLVKIIFLREDLFTDYDYQVLAEWERAYTLTNGDEGIMPGTLAKMRFLKKHKHPWFREVLLVMGRRAGKGHIAALCLAYVLWCYMAKGDPQQWYGVDRDKQMVCLIFAGKRDQAKANVFGDVVNVVTGSNCFTQYISEDHAEKLSIKAPHDKIREARQHRKGLYSGRDQATFLIQPRESTMMAGRGPTSFAQAFDEMAHIVATGANRSAEEVYDAAKPSLDQFGKDSFIIEPSSPWQMIGQFYENFTNANSLDENGDFAYPDMLTLQLSSWDIYRDWERAPEIPLFPEGYLGTLKEYDPASPDHLPHPGFKHFDQAISTYDDQMAREEKAKPETFKVERRAKWAAVLDAYLNEEMVAKVFDPWLGRPAKYGPPELTMQTQGVMATTYKGHADPSKVNDKFGVALGHVEYDDDAQAHCVFDLLHDFDPADYPNHIIDYDDVDEWIWERVIKPFMPGEFTYDQYNSASSIQRLQKQLRRQPMPRRVEVFEKTVTRPYDWMVKENTKAAINFERVHAPYYERAELELRFLQLVNGKVDHPSAGPVQSKDVADCICEVVHVLIGEQVNNFVHGDLASLKPGMALQGGVQTFPSSYPDHETNERVAALAAFGKGRGRPEYTPSRNPTRRSQRNGSRY